jgi:hypothetical protein
MTVVHEALPGTAMRQILYTCDVCGVQKKEANHWFIIFRTTTQVRAVQMERGRPNWIRRNPPVRRELRQPQDHAANRRYA